MTDRKFTAEISPEEAEAMYPKMSEEEIGKIFHAVTEALGAVTRAHFPNIIRASRGQTKRSIKSYAGLLAVQLIYIAQLAKKDDADVKESDVIRLVNEAFNAELEYLRGLAFAKEIGLPEEMTKNAKFVFVDLDRKQ